MSQPLGLKWAVLAMVRNVYRRIRGVAIDLLVYSIIIPVLPFRLEALGYTHVSSLVGWLLFSYSGGLAFSAIPIAYGSERYAMRWWPLVLGLFVLLAAQVMLMEAPNYAVMCIARILQGVSSSVIWIVGLALLCDTTPETRIGRQLGFVMMGISFGLVVGPPIGGLLYARLGYRAPFVFSMMWAAVDLLGRLLIIERKDAVKYGYDPATLLEHSIVQQEAGPVALDKSVTPYPCANSPRGNLGQPTVLVRPKPLSLLAVIAKLLKSPRAVAAIILSIVFGAVWTAQETGLPLHLQAVWGIGPLKAGLILLAGVVPTLISSPITGWYADTKGSEWVLVLTLALSIPWWCLMIIQSSLALFIVVYVFQTFFTSAVVPPITAELAGVSRNIEGVGYAHVYGAFNLAYGIGTTIGPILGGQIYSHVSRGWLAICCLGAGFLALCVPLCFAFTGDRPLLSRIKHGKQRKEENSPTQ